jgi:hypothetical protein
LLAADMDLVLLGSTTRERIVPRARVMRHRRIPVIQQRSKSPVSSDAGSRDDV